jgi:hypothetical protein
MLHERLWNRKKHARKTENIPPLKHRRLFASLYHTPGRRKHQYHCRIAGPGRQTDQFPAILSGTEEFAFKINGRRIDVYNGFPVGIHSIQKFHHGPHYVFWQHGPRHRFVMRVSLEHLREKSKREPLNFSIQAVRGADGITLTSEEAKTVQTPQTACCRIIFCYMSDSYIQSGFSLQRSLETVFYGVDFSL